MKTKDKFPVDRVSQYKVFMPTANGFYSTSVMAESLITSGDELIFFKMINGERTTIAIFRDWSYFIRVEPTRFRGLSPFVCCPCED